MRSLKEKLKNLSLMRLSGCRDFILVELNGTIAKLIHLKLDEKIYQLEKKQVFKNLKAGLNRKINFDYDFNILIKEFDSFKTETGINEPVLLIGINEFKFSSISIPAGIDSAEDEEEIWFSENTSKFLPEGSTPGTFAYSYEKIKEDEDYKTYALVIARKDYLNKIKTAFKKHKIASIFPFVTSTFSYAGSEEINNLIIDFSTNKLLYAFSDGSGNFFSGEFYSNIFGNQFSLTAREIDNDELKNSLVEIKNFLTSSFANIFSKRITLYINCQKTELPLIKEQVNDFWGINSSNEGIHNIDPFFTSSCFALNKFVNQFDTGLNLLDDEETINSRDNFEKQAGLRVVLGFGIVLILLLLFSYLGNYLLSYQVSANEGITEQLENSKNQVSLLEKEIFLLKNNLTLLKSLKENRTGYSDLLLNISENINQDSRLTELQITENNSGKIKLNINGLSHSQNDVAELMGIMEQSKLYNNITLSNISSEDNSGKKIDGFEFKLTADYYADKK